MFIQCSNCGFHFETRPMLGIPEGMYYDGYRAVGSALYCPECVKNWKERNGAEFGEQYGNPSKMFANWWNNKVNSFVDEMFGGVLSALTEYLINTQIHAF